MVNDIKYLDGTQTIYNALVAQDEHTSYQTENDDLYMGSTLLALTIDGTDTTDDKKTTWSAKKLSQLSEDKVNQPKDGNGVVVNGTAGQVLSTNGDGSTKWVDAQLGGQIPVYESLDDVPDAYTGLFIILESSDDTPGIYQNAKVVTVLHGVTASQVDDTMAFV